MINDKYLTYKELMALALKYYDKGGDSTYECLDERTFNEDPYYQTMTEQDAIKSFRLDAEIRADICGY